MTTFLCESLGATYERCLVPVPGHDAPATALISWLRDETTNICFPVQVAPRLATDPAGDPGGEALIALMLTDLLPGQILTLEKSLPPRWKLPSPSSSTTDAGTIIRNGDYAVLIPTDGPVESPYPGPIVGVDWGNGFNGGTDVVDVPYRGLVTTTIESIGPAFVQWCTVYRWGNCSELRFHVRWAAGADTFSVIEEIAEDSAAALEWRPFSVPASAYIGGGGEAKGPMRALTIAHDPQARRGQGRHRLGCLSHISYFNQWNFAWVGCVPTGTTDSNAPFLGIFSGWGAHWQNRGAVRPEIWHDQNLGVRLRFPLRHGRRCYGVILSTATRALGTPSQRCLPNRRKAMLSDLRLDKVDQWQLNSPTGARKMQLVDPGQVHGFRSRLAADPTIAVALDTFLVEGNAGHGGRLAAAWWKQDPLLVAQRLAELVTRITADRADVIDGGYERLLIFDGRFAKTIAYDIDQLWADGQLSEHDFNDLRQWLIILAYMFADADYCRYEDFPTSRGDDVTVAVAMCNEMGRTPVPPNFAAEFFSTVGVVAELFPDHPQSLTWRAFALTETAAFLDNFFAADGSYFEALNYQDHICNELICLWYPLWRKGVHNWFADRRVKGYFQHLIDVQIPPNTDAKPPRHNLWHTTVCADPSIAQLTLLPANGNSGDDGKEVQISDSVVIGAAVYRQQDPTLSAALMGLWHRGGKPLFKSEHPVLSLLLLNPLLPDAPPPSYSVWRESQFVISRNDHRSDTPMWALFRAGRATNHMCFDQGHIHLAAWDRVLLGDYGYHARDTDGSGLPVAATWLHNTIVYSDDRHMSSGYTGLECAPEPVFVHLGKDFDWCVHRIINTNHRRLGFLPYNELLIVPTTQHVRHYLFVKDPGYIVVWDHFEEAHTPSTFWLHPRYPVTDLGHGAFRSGNPDEPHLAIRFATPEDPLVVENRPCGNLWSLGLQNARGAPWITIFRPQREDHPLSVTWDAQTRRCHISGLLLNQCVIFPEPGNPTHLPQIERRS